jgi:hypothetical protein
MEAAMKAIYVPRLPPWSAPQPAQRPADGQRTETSTPDAAKSASQGRLAVADGDP